MKNKLLICVLLSFSIIMSCINVYATENAEEPLMIKATDSLLKSDDKQLQKLGVSVDEQAIKVYNLCLVEAFSRCDNIDDMVSEWSVFSPEYFIVSGDSIDRVVVMNEKDEIEQVFMAEQFENGILEKYKLSITEFLNKNAIKLIATDVKIEHCYYFYGESTQGDGIAIYYETNYGAFVYYCRGASEYLFPLEKFVAMMKRVDNGRGPDTPPGSNIIAVELNDLSKYDIHSADFEITTDTQQNEYTLGDVNGNGEIDSMDYVLLKRAYFGTYALSGITAGDINGSDEIDSMDYVLLKRAYFGTYDLNKQNDGIEESIDVIQPTFGDYDEYVRYLETLTLPDYFVSYEDLSEFGEFKGFVRLTPDAYSDLFYIFVDETGTEYCMYVYCPPLKSPIGTEIFEIEDEQINASDMRNATIVDSKARKYTYQGIEYVYSIHGEIMSIRWCCGDIKYIVSGISGYPSTDKNTMIDRLLNLETAPSVINNLKSYTIETNN